VYRFLNIYQLFFSIWTLYYIISVCVHVCHIHRCHHLGDSDVTSDVDDSGPDCL